MVHDVSSARASASQGHRRWRRLLHRFGFVPFGQRSVRASLPASPSTLPTVTPWSSASRTDGAAVRG